jgi:hypothetical protein
VSGMGSEDRSNKVCELRGTFTLSDLVRFQYFYSLRRIWWVTIVVTLLVFAEVILAAVLVVEFHNYEIVRYGTPIVLLFLLWLGVIAVLPYGAARKQLKTGVSIREPIIYAFSPQGIRYKSAFSSGETSWKAFWRICETRRLFCLYFSANSAWVLPKRFFKDEAEQSGWRRLVEEQIAPKKITEPGFVGRRT